MKLFYLICIICAIWIGSSTQLPLESAANLGFVTKDGWSSRRQPTSHQLSSHIKYHPLRSNFQNEVKSLSGSSVNRQIHSRVRRRVEDTNDISNIFFSDIFEPHVILKRATFVKGEEYSEPNSLSDDTKNTDAPLPPSPSPPPPSDGRKNGPHKHHVGHHWRCNCNGPNPQYPKRFDSTSGSRDTVTTLPTQGVAKDNEQNDISPRTKRENSETEIKSDEDAPPPPPPHGPHGPRGPHGPHSPHGPHGPHGRHRPGPCKCPKPEESSTGGTISGGKDEVTSARGKRESEVNDNGDFTNDFRVKRQADGAEETDGVPENPSPPKSGDNGGVNEEKRKGGRRGGGRRGGRVKEEGEDEEGGKRRKGGGRRGGRVKEEGEDEEGGKGRKGGGRRGGRVKEEGEDEEGGKGRRGGGRRRQGDRKNGGQRGEGGGGGEEGGPPGRKSRGKNGKKNPQGTNPEDPKAAMPDGDDAAARRKREADDTTKEVKRNKRESRVNVEEEEDDDEEEERATPKTKGMVPSQGPGNQKTAGCYGYGRRRMGGGGGGGGGGGAAPGGGAPAPEGGAEAAEPEAAEYRRGMAQKLRQQKKKSKKKKKY